MFHFQSPLTSVVQNGAIGPTVNQRNSEIALALKQAAGNDRAIHMRPVTTGRARKPDPFVGHISKGLKKSKPQVVRSGSIVALPA